MLNCIARFAQAFIGFVKNLRYYNKNKDCTEVKASIAIRNFVLALKPKIIFWDIYISVSLGIMAGLVSYLKQNYIFMNVLLVSSTTPQIAATPVLLFAILFLCGCIINQKLALLADGLCHKLENITDKISIHKVFYISLFSCLLFNSYIVTIFLLESVKSYGMLCVMIIEFNFLQPLASILLIMYINMFKNVATFFSYFITKKANDENILRALRS